jgi:hypothetical protein
MDLIFDCISIMYGWNWNILRVYIINFKLQLNGACCLDNNVKTLHYGIWIKL